MSSDAFRQRTILHRAAGAAVAAALIVAPMTAAAPAGASGAPATTAKCKRAKIGGRRTCVAVGQYCNRRYEKQYVRYGLSCVKQRGRYRLVSNHLTF